MKKIIASISVLVYFAFACGVMVNYHFCMDRYHSFSLYQPTSQSCATCGMQTKTRGCCHSDVRIVKLQNDYQTSSSPTGFKEITPVLVATSSFLASELISEENHSLKTDHSPPLLVQNDIYLRNRVFRI